jgi:outer membrane protein assembly factor BamB
LYLINSTGRVLWKNKLDERIKSEIFQIDFYQNGKLQYLFNTASGIHLIDRNGNYVERYPVKFRADATNGLALFDYDNRKEYRIFVACSDRKVYVYDIEGNIIPGWKFPQSEGVVEKTIQHFRLKEKDYIVFSDPIRTYMLDRRGRERVKQKELVAVSKNNQFYLDMNLSGGTPRLLTTDIGGNVIEIDFEGNMKKILTNSATGDHFFRIKDINQDGAVEYIFADGNELKVIDSEGERFFSYKIKSDIEMLPDIYQFSVSDVKIGITDSENNRIYLINSDGSVYEGFPLEGNTRYSIGYFTGSDSRFNLIVGSANGFIYNYSIE